MIQFKYFWGFIRAVTREYDDTGDQKWQSLLPHYLITEIVSRNIMRKTSYVGDVIIYLVEELWYLLNSDLPANNYLDKLSWSCWVIEKDSYINPDHVFKYDSLDIIMMVYSIHINILDLISHPGLDVSLLVPTIRLIVRWPPSCYIHYYQTFSLDKKEANDGFQEFQVIHCSQYKSPAQVLSWD